MYMRYIGGGVGHALHYRTSMECDGVEDLVVDEERDDKSRAEPAEEMLTAETNDSNGLDESESDNTESEDSPGSSDDDEFPDDEDYDIDFNGYISM
jgi:hypothetical protein